MAHAAHPVLLLLPWAPGARCLSVCRSAARAQLQPAASRRSAPLPQVPEVEALKGRVMRALAAVPGDGASLSSVVTAVLAPEGFWTTWKAGGSSRGSAAPADQ